MELQPVKVSISENQFSKLRMGRPIQLSASALKNGKHTLFLGPENVRKVMKAKKNQKGVRISLSVGELEKSAEGLKDFLKKAKVFYDKHVKSHVAPILKKGVQTLANVALTEAEALAPEFAPFLEKGRKYIPKATEKLGEMTGAYGIPKNLIVEGNWNTRLNPYHPARWNPEAGMYVSGMFSPRTGGYACDKCGGSFRPSGGYVIS